MKQAFKISEFDMNKFVVIISNLIQKKISEGLVTQDALIVVDLIDIVTEGEIKKS
jgi:hypothetical protein